jgi:LacI family transcriptional regulator
MATMRDVAKLAGVSAPTVSYVINNGPRPVSDETRARVIRAIEKLGYQPNRLARVLARKTSRSIALIIPDSSDLFFARLSRAVEQVAYSSGFNLFLCNAGKDIGREMSYFSLLAEKHVDGILLITCGIDAAMLTHAIPQDFPLVILDREIQGALMDTVVFDNYAAGKQAAEHLLKHGYSRVACLAGPRSLYGAVQRVDGYKAAVREAGITLNNELIRWSDYTFDGGLREALQLLNRTDHPDAIVACNDDMGVAAIHAARERGMHVPGDVAVMGIGDSFIGRAVIPQLSTVSASVDEMGRMGAELLLERIKGTAPFSQRHIILKTVPLARESCGCPHRVTTRKLRQSKVKSAK